MNDNPIDTLQEATPIATLPVMEVPEGKTPSELSHGPLYDTGAMTVLLLNIFLIVVSYRTGYKYIRNFGVNLFSARPEGNVFDDHTVSDLRIMFSLVFNTCVMEGLLTFYAVALFAPQWRAELMQHVFLSVGAFTLLALAFHLMQHALMALLGFVFSDAERTACWLDGLKATQSILGLLLFPIVVLLLVFPAASSFALILAVIIYIFTRIVFIFKGFRIFFAKLSQSVYFILYLCNVEIIPPIFYCVLAVGLCGILF